MILVGGSKMLPKSHCMLKAKKMIFIFLEEAFSNSCAMCILVEGFQPSVGLTELEANTGMENVIYIIDTSLI